MGLFDRFRKNEPTDVEQYQKELNARRTAQGPGWHSHPSEEPEFQPGVTLLTVEDTFSIGDRTVVTGKAQAHFSVGERIWVVLPNGTRKESAVAGLEMFRRTLDTAHPGDSVGVYLRGLRKAEVCKGAKLLRG